MAELQLEAKRDNLSQLQEFLDTTLMELGCPMKLVIPLQIAAEEIYINIASYAYEGGEGSATILADKVDGQVRLQFIDQGTPYDPLAREDPDVTLSAEERPIGGLGIYMVKKSMDDVTYEYRDGSNILTLWKRIA